MAKRREDTKMGTRGANMWAMRSLAEIFKPTFGPKGSYKVLMNSMGQYVVTKDGATILKELDIGYPGLRMMARISKVMEDEVGDGTKLAVILTGALLEKAEMLLNQGLHPAVIMEGYRLAAERGIRAINDLAMDAEKGPRLKQIARTAMTGRMVGDWTDHLVDIVGEAVEHIIKSDADKIEFNPEDVLLVKKQGGGIKDTRIIKGAVIEKERAHPGMPRRVIKARIALLNLPLEIKFKKSKYKSIITLNRIDERADFLNAEEARVREMVDKIAGAGASVVFCNKGIDDAVKYGLVKKGIFALERTRKQDIEKLAKSTGAIILETLNGIGADALGFAGVVEETKISGNSMTLVRECENPRSLSILIRGGSQNVVDEVERSFQDGFGVIKTFLQEKKIVAGGGALEMELSGVIQKFARTFDDKKQLAIEAFGESLVEIPKVIAKNTGMKPLDVLTILRKRHEEGCVGCGVDMNGGAVRDMYRLGVVEPARMKMQALESASEVANAILRIDGVISSGRDDEKTKGFVKGENDE